MTVLLVMTTGQTDVQLVMDGRRQEFCKDKCACLHDEVERRVGEWRLVDAPLSKSKPTESLPDGAIDLCTPKLDAVLRYLDEKGAKPATALILGTRRDASSSRSDPRYAGAILEARLRECGIADVQAVSFLIGAESKEDRNHPRDAIVRREVVNRIEEAVRGSLVASRPAQIFVASTGGFPVVNTLVEEIVSLYGRTGRVEVLECHDGAIAQTQDRAVPRRGTPEPAASYQARRHALDLIDKGNLLGAWGAVAHLHEDEVEHRWTQVIEWLALFAASMPLPKECDIPVLVTASMAVRAALRVELALRAGDIPRAVHGTVAFFEAAFWDWIRRYDFAAEGIEKIDDVTYKFSKPLETRKRFKEVKSGLPKINDREEGINDWLDVLNKPNLKRYWVVLSDNIRNLRNDVVHNEPTPKMMEDAKREMNRVHLWSVEGGFLSQSLVRNILLELGEGRPEHLCVDLVSTVLSRFLVPDPHCLDN